MIKLTEKESWRENESQVLVAFFIVTSHANLPGKRPQICQISVKEIVNIFKTKPLVWGTFSSCFSLKFAVSEFSSSR